MVFCPSFVYLDLIVEKLQEIGDIPGEIIAQVPEMKPEERETFEFALEFRFRLNKVFKNIGLKSIKNHVNYILFARKSSQLLRDFIAVRRFAPLLVSVGRHTNNLEQGKHDTYFPGMSRQPVPEPPCRKGKYDPQ